MHVRTDAVNRDAASFHCLDHVENFGAFVVHPLRAVVVVEQLHTGHGRACRLSIDQSRVY